MIPSLVKTLIMPLYVNNHVYAYAKRAASLGPIKDFDPDTMNSSIRLIVLSILFFEVF